jgi:hypothetical protein
MFLFVDFGLAGGGMQINACKAFFNSLSSLETEGTRIFSVYRYPLLGVFRYILTTIAVTTAVAFTFQGSSISFLYVALHNRLATTPIRSKAKFSCGDPLDWHH